MLPLLLLSGFWLAAPAGAADFQAVLESAPYIREVKGLLRLIERHAPEPAKARAAEVLSSSAPAIVIDGGLLGDRLRSRTMPDGKIALGPGLAFRSERGLFSKPLETAAADAPEGRPEDAWDAFAADRVPAKIAASDWGPETQFFKDGSARARFSPEQMAGSLLYELTRGRRDYGSEVAARTWQWMFYAEAAARLGSDAFLDPEERALLRQWLDHPQDARDHLAHCLLAGRDGGAEGLEPAMREERRFRLARARP